MELQLNDIWQAALGELEVVLSTANFNTWFKDTSILDIDDGKVVVAVPNNFSKEWLQKKYHQDILKTLRKLNNSISTVSYTIAAVQHPSLVIPSPTARASAVTADITQNNSRSASPFPLKPEFTFDSFVVGPHNRLAHATSLAVSQNPGKTHNPLFIYGGVGLGKTHLLCAVGNALVKNSPSIKILYVSCEDFANEYIASIQNKTTEDFKKKYRSVDVFLIDDIQFLSKKEGTQEEFFHTFNHLYQNNCQIIMTSDRIPRAIPDLEERLSSRFGWGMVADITTPNFETRQAILHAKCQEKNWEVGLDVLEYIATNITSSIRELEGALNRVIAHCELHKEQPSVNIAQAALENMVTGQQSKTISPDKVIKTVAKFFNITVADLMSPKRSRDLVFPRQITMYLMRSDLSLSYPQIGRALGGKDHTTIIHGYTLINREIARNDSLREQIQIIKERVYGV